MDTLIDRRRMLSFMGGLALGTAASPLPWKLLDDISIWTQNYPWAAKIPRGKLSEIHSHCPICPGGCGVRISTIGSIAYAVRPVLTHPLSLGHLCPLGLCGHHLLVHPNRLDQARLRTRPGNKVRDISMIQGIETLASWISETGKQGGTLALIDSKPGTVDSSIYLSTLTSFPNSHYVPLVGEQAPLLALADLSAIDPGRPSVNLDVPKHLLCFGGTISDGWGSSAALSKVVGKQGAKKTTVVLSIDQSAPAFADRVIYLTPGSEGFLALGIAKYLLDAGLIDLSLLGARIHDLDSGPTGGFLSLLDAFDGPTVASICNIAETTIADLASDLIEAPSLVLALGHLADDCADRDTICAIMSLNILLGNIGTDSSVVFSACSKTHKFHEELTGSVPETPFTALEDGSIDLMIIDNRRFGSLPSQAKIHSKLRDPDHSRVVRLSSFRCDEDLSWDLLLSVPGHYEQREEIAAPTDQRRNCYGFSMPLISPLKEISKRPNPVTQAKRLINFDRTISTEKEPTREDLISKRVTNIFERRDGVVYDPNTGNGESIELKHLSSAKALMSILCRGGLWLSEESPSFGQFEYRLLGEDGRLLDRLFKTASSAGIPAATIDPAVKPAPRHLRALPDFPLIMSTLLLEDDRLGKTR